MSFFLIFIIVLYVILIISLAIGCLKTDMFIADKTTVLEKFSVLIPFRNEAENLPVLLESIVALEYPKELFEVIFIDDTSKDNSIEIIEHFLEQTTINFSTLKNVRSTNSPKKDAISLAIKNAKFNWIVTTDADCKLPKKWLEIFNEFVYKENPNMIVAPVNYSIKNSFLHQFQLLDFMSLQASTLGGFGINFPFLCNGANLAYKKEIFNKLNGFEGNSDIASGDDIFLFQKFLQFDRSLVKFLKSKEVVVTTFPLDSWKDLINQRVRWASKTSKTNNLGVKLIGLLIFLINLSLIGSLIYTVNNHNFHTSFLYLFLTKLFIDILLFMPIIRFFQHSKIFLKIYFLSAILYPFFSVFIVLYALFFSFKWKGRVFKK